MWENEYLVPGPVCDVAEAFIPFFSGDSEDFVGFLKNSQFWLFNHKCKSALATLVEKQ